MKKINKKELHEIFEELRNKSEGAYNKLYQNYYSLVFGITFSILKNKEDSEDITHEIFTKIYKLDIDKLPINNEASWLFTVSKNECFIYLRRIKPDISIDEIYEIPTSSNDIDNIIDIEYFNNLISGLKEDEKLIVSMKVLSNFTFKKISQVMGIPIGTVQWKYYNAINSLKVSIGSLVGAIIAFVIVISRGEFWNKKEYLNENKNLDEDGYKNNEDEKSIINNDESLIESNKTNSGDSTNQEANVSLEGNADTNKNTNIDVQDSQDEHKNFNNERDSNKNNGVDEGQNVSESFTIASNSVMNEKSLKINTLQLTFLTVGITFLVIFLISFKFYQQKLKKKASK